MRALQFAADDDSHLALMNECKRRLANDSKLLRHADFKVAYDHLLSFFSSRDARDTPTNIGRLEEASRLAVRCRQKLGDPKQKLKASLLEIVASYHLAAYTACDASTQDESW